MKLLRAAAALAAMSAIVMLPSAASAQPETARAADQSTRISTVTGHPGTTQNAVVIHYTGGGGAARLAASVGQCDEDYHLCMWTGDNYTGYFVSFGGNYAACQGWRWEGTVFQDHVWSMWNRVSGPVSFWNRYADGTYRYTKIGWYLRGYADSSRFSTTADAWVYDPGNTCTSLDLALL